MRASRLALAHPAPRGVAAGAAVLLAASGCVPRAIATGSAGTAPLPALAVGADSAMSTTVAPGVVHHRLWFARGPQAVHVLDVDRAACWTLAARKAGGAAVGRAGTLALVRGLADSGGVPVAGGVNADFFLFAPPGVPVGAHVQDGRVIAGPAPGPRPALALDSAGGVWMGALRDGGTVAVPNAALPLDAWNRGSTDGVAVFDAAWGARTDSMPGRVHVTARLLPDARGALTAVVTAVDSGAHAAIPADGIVLSAGARSGDARSRLAALRPGRDTVKVTRTLGPVRPRQAVGGLPMLLRGGAIDPQVDSTGNAGFRGANPRTAVGVGAGGRRLFLVTIDGRQAGYSLGTTLRETAEIMRALGASDAINLDGGGSTTMVVREPAGGFRIANRPSDAAGERPVANALVVARGGCAAP